MGQFPDTLYTPRTVENRAGVSYDAAKTKVFYAEDLNTPNAEIIAIEETLGLNPEGAATTVGDRISAVEADIAALNEVGGWFSLAVTPTRQSTDDPIFVLRFAADMTAILQPGHRIKLTQQSTVKFFIVHVVGSYTGGNTDVTVYGGTDYDVNDTSTYPITYPYFSRDRQPVGFPFNPTTWSTVLTDTNQRLQSSPANNTYYNLGSLSLTIPIGLWDVDFQISARSDRAAAGATQLFAALSTSVSSASDLELQAYVILNPLTNSAFFVTRRKFLTLTLKTVYYLIMKCDGSPTFDF